MTHVRFMESGKDIERCFPIMLQLRTRLVREEFVERINRQQQLGYRLVSLEVGEQVKAVAGFRLSEALAWGKFLYVDDLVTDTQDRSQGYGGILFDWLVQYAKSHSCAQMHLDSGVQRFAAHRFYLKKRMAIAAHHFSLELDTSSYSDFITKVNDLPSF